MVQALKLSEVPKIANLVKRIAVKRDQRAAQKMVKRLASSFYEQQVTPNHFLSMETDLEGEILIGHTLNERAFGLNRDVLNRHTFISSQSGFGKSNLIKLLFYQAREKGIHAIHFDRKGDLEHAVRYGMDSISWRHFRRNPLCPPGTQVDIREWRNDFVKAFCELQQFWQRGLSLFLIGVDLLYKKFDVYRRWQEWDWNTMTFPTLIDLLAVFRSPEYTKRIKGQGKESMFSIIDKLISLIIELEPIVSCERGIEIAKLYQERRAVNYNVDGLSVEYQNFLIVCEILNYAHFFRTHGPRGQLNTLLFFDEAKGILGKQNQDKFIVKDLVSKIRELGIGLVCADQIPSEISQFFFSNIGTLIMLRHSDGFDLQRLRYSSGATPDQILDNYSLKPGQAIIRSMKCKDLHRVNIPFEAAEKFISREELDRLMAPRLKELHDEVIPVGNGQGADQRTTEDEPKTDSFVVTDEERIFLEHLAKNFDRPSSEIYGALGISTSTGYRLKQRLLRKGLISELKTNLGKDGKRAIFLLPNPVTFEMLGIELGPGRGGLLHKRFQSSHKINLEKLGFNVVIEDSVGGTPEAPDLGVERNGKRVAVEICVTSKPRHEAANIEKNLRLGFSHVVLSFLDNKVLVKTKEIAGEDYSVEVLNSVTFCRVNEVCSILGRL